MKLQQVAHGGGLRFEANSEPYKIIFDWIAAGVPFGQPGSTNSLRIETLI